MLSYTELLNLEPPPNLTGEELQAWMIKQVCEPDGTFIMADDWAKEPSKPE